LPKKRTEDLVLFAFLLFTANKSNLPIHFMGESTARQSAFRFYLTFTKANLVFHKMLFLKGFEIRGRKKTIKNLRAITFPLHMLMRK